jgi:hypothetical protein
LAHAIVQVMPKPLLLVVTDADNLAFKAMAVADVANDKLQQLALVIVK